MSRMSFQAAATMSQLQNKLDTIGNNLSNVNTHGYKTRNTDFTSLLAQQLEQEDDPANEENRQTPEGIRLGMGARLGHTNLNLTQGSLETTDRALDVALRENNHMFQINVNENGVEETRYTRAGNFYLSPTEGDQVMLTTSDGNPVLGEEGSIVLDNNMDDINIDEQGQIFVTRNGVEQQEGQLAITEAVRPRMLEATGNNLFRLSQDTIDNYPVDEIVEDVAVADVNVQSGALETSNVDMATQMTNLTQTQRAYQFNGRTISMNDQMQGLINQLR
ncbi:flagellar hook-basal body complex protein FlhP [Gracilibacillus halophilus YIM-C55.5]|uniref:Flagellar hook-basal body complex protein FlhP n=1 Tax=Gracilibacillus halophilus YIM-C55.5 TaxID=1308866 RepID=N4WKA5_9BACI|nr:flagellar hook-basal body protein [Gracilibacillus halophilus]ENH96567.1 flagellar hook-basal body complex protein FlhP [Gracilibacillus halophilus YIM-C55.5]